MHSYSIDSKARRECVIIIFVISMAVSLILCRLLFGSTTFISIVKHFRDNDVVRLMEWWGAVPSLLTVSAIYGLLACIFDNVLWKYAPFRLMHKIPDLNGTWEGILESSFNGEKIPMKLTIKQTWTSISLKSEYCETSSYSYSNVAAICIKGNRGIALYFGYTNNSKKIGNCPQIHDGYNILVLENKDSLNGKYFNDRKNPNSAIKGGNLGTITLTRKHRTNAKNM